MLTPIEQQTFQDDFNLLLLGSHVDIRQNQLAFKATLYAGGKETATETFCEAYGSPAPEVFPRLRRLVLQVAREPHVLVVYGRGWQGLLDQVIPNLQSAFRILDLHRAAVSLAPEPIPGQGIRETAGAYVTDHALETPSPFPPVVDDLLWALIHRAGTIGMGWPELLRAPETKTPRVDFSGYRFSELTLATLPAGPGIYVMTDRQGRTIYVGKAASLARRLPDYFRAQRTLPPKIRTIRQRIRDFRTERVGSELEALLLENRLIEKLAPDLNTQRDLSPGSRRYPLHPIPTMVILPSVALNRLEIFAFGTRHECLQLRVCPRRLPRQTLARITAFFLEQLPVPPRHPHLHAWGNEGNLLAMRYLARVRNRLSWLEITPQLVSEEGIDKLAKAVATVDASPDAATFLLNTDDAP